MFGAIETDYGNLASLAPVAYHRRYSQPHMQPWHKPPHWSNHNGRQNFENINFNYWCETCDKGFRSSAHLEIHKQQHQKCNIDGCQFIAHPKVITKHIQMQHSTGLYKKISKLNNPEEIKKWREERKRKYPTKENIDKRTAEMKEKNDRGEKMGINKYQKRRDFNNSDGRNRKTRSFSSKYDHQNNRRKRPLPNNINSDVEPNSKKTFKSLIIVEEEPRKLKPFSGIQGLILDDDDDGDDNGIKETRQNVAKDLIEDDEFAEDITVTEEYSLDVLKPKLCGALTSLMCDYGSSDEDVNEVNKDNNNKDNSKDNEFSEEATKDKMSAAGRKDTKENAVDSKNNQDATKNSENHDSQLFSEKKLQIVDVNENCQVNNIENKSSRSKDTINRDNIENKDNDSDSGPEETKVVVVRSIEETKQEHHQIKMPKVKRNKIIVRERKPLKRKLPSTLLEKLLHREIEQERNIILQCIRYIVKSNYFEQNKSSDY